VGGHSFNTKSNDGKFDYTASCKSCHGDIKDFNLKAKADFDENGKVEGVKEEIKGLLNAVWKALEAKGVKQSASHPYWVPPRDAQGNVDDKLENAFYNFRLVYGVMWHADESGKIVPGNEGAAQAMHNFKRACALLQLSLKDLGAMPAGAADCTK
jgi:isopentenyl phosphate kinase